MTYFVRQQWAGGATDVIGRFDNIAQASAEAQRRLSYTSIVRAEVFTR